MTEHRNKYNGWANYETWNINLWISDENEECLYHLKRQFIEQFDNHSDCGEVCPHCVEQFCRILFPEGTPDFDEPADLDLVDWREIADHWTEEGIAWRIHRVIDKLHQHRSASEDERTTYER